MGHPDGYFSRAVANFSIHDPARVEAHCVQAGLLFRGQMAVWCYLLRRTLSISRCSCLVRQPGKPAPTSLALAVCCLGRVQGGMHHGVSLIVSTRGRLVACFGISERINDTAGLFLLKKEWRFICHHSRLKRDESIDFPLPSVSCCLDV
jgi:hypothetical protein